MEIKTIKFSQGVLEYTRNDNSVEFYCDRCNSVKKSRTVVKWKDRNGNENTVCNGCYGLLLSKENK